MSFLNHVQEIRKRLFSSLFFLLIGIGIAFYFYEEIYQFLTKPFYLIEKFQNNHFHIKGILDGFFIKFKISVLFGVFVTFPIHIFHLLRFLLPALSITEKKIIFYALLSSFCLVCLSFVYSYSYIIPISLKFLTNQGFIPPDINIWLEYGKNIFYILQFLFFSVIIFQTPIVLLILIKFKIFSVQTLWKQSRFVVVGIVILSAIITPPDIISQVAFAFPLIILFFLSLLIGKMGRF